MPIRLDVLVELIRGSLNYALLIHKRSNWLDSDR